MCKLKIVFVLLMISFPKLSYSNPDAKRLYDDLLSNYNRLIRPVSNNTDTVLVKLGLRLSQLIELVSILIFFLGSFSLNNLFFYLEFERSNINDQRLVGTRKQNFLSYTG